MILQINDKLDEGDTPKKESTRIFKSTFFHTKPMQYNKILQKYDKI